MTGWVRSCTRGADLESAGVILVSSQVSDCNYEYGEKFISCLGN